MSDLTIGLDTSNYDVVGDLVRGDLDLLTGDELKTSVVVSLFTELGWWANLYEADDWGSGLETLFRAKHSNETLLKARDYCRQALAWLIEDSIASAVDVNTGWIGDVLAIAIAITQAAGVTHYSFAWNGV